MHAQGYHLCEVYLFDFNDVYDTFHRSVSFMIEWMRSTVREIEAAIQPFGRVAEWLDPENPPQICAQSKDE